MGKQDSLKSQTAANALTLKAAIWRADTAVSRLFSAGFRAEVISFAIIKFTDSIGSASTPMRPAPR